MHGNYRGQRRKLRNAYTRWHETKGASDQMWLDLMADNIRVLSLAAGAPGVEFTSEVRSKKDLARYGKGWYEFYDTASFLAATQK